MKFLKKQPYVLCKRRLLFLLIWKKEKKNCFSIINIWKTCVYQIKVMWYNMQKHVKKQNKTGNYITEMTMCQGQLVF